MPSPLGHAIGGLVAAFAVDSIARRPRLTLPLLAAAAVVAVTPDLDLLVGSHRTYTHSIGAVAVIGLISWLVLRARHPRSAGAAVLTAAYASHLLLDWLSKDTREPSGVTALWPFTAKYYQSAWTVFGETSRRYWLPEEFIISNIKTAIGEIALIAPLLFMAWTFWSRRTLTTKTEERKTNTASPTR
jgi:membrane-bound metal-dependent hydrolase YbcI (DUF457 family)